MALSVFIRPLFYVVQCITAEICSDKKKLKKTLEYWNIQPSQKNFSVRTSGCQLDNFWKLPHFCELGVPTSTNRYVIWGSLFLFLPVDTSDLNNWGHFEKSWGQVLYNWHPLLCMPTIIQTSMNRVMIWWKKFAWSHF